MLRMAEPVSPVEPDLGVVSLDGAARILGVKKGNVRDTLRRRGLIPQELPNGPLWATELVRAVAAERAAETEAREADERRRAAALKNAAGT